MRKFRVWLRLFLTFFLVTVFLEKEASADPKFSLYRTDEQVHEEISKSLEKMPLEVKVGQLFIFGFSGKTLDHNLRWLISDLKPGAIIVFGHNIQSAKQIGRLIYEAQTLSLQKWGVPLFIAVDQEGGDVIRIRTNPPLPSALALGQTGDENLVEKAGYHTGRLLGALGFNMNLAPVLDISDPNHDSFIGTRSYSNNPVVVSRLGKAFAHGLLSAGILPTAKHFPGHGEILGDSHTSMTLRPKTLNELLKFDLLPYLLISKELRTPPAVMVAHVAYPSIDPSRLPATYSPILLNEVLRKQLQFSGLVVTDDIEMYGAQSIPDVGERAVRAIEAGNDLVMVVWTKRVKKAVYQAVLNAARSGRLSENRINDSVRRILYFKNRYASPQRIHPPNPELMARALQSKELREVADEVILTHLRRGVNEKVLNAFSTQKEPVYVMSATQRFSKGLRSTLKAHSVVPVPIHAGALSDVQARFEKRKEALGIYYVTGKQSLALLEKLPESVAQRTVVLNTLTRGKIDKDGRYLAIIDVYSAHPSLGEFTGRWITKATADYLRQQAARAPASPE